MTVDWCYFLKCVITFAVRFIESIEIIQNQCYWPRMLVHTEFIAGLQ